MKLAYLLVVHNNPEQLNNFIQQLVFNGDCDIYIHVDKKSENLIPQIISNEHVFIFSEYYVNWGSFEIVKAAILLMEKARNSGCIYTHFYFGSGNDLLVRKGLYEYLSKEDTDVFMDIYHEVKLRSREASRFLVAWPQKYMIRNDLHLYRFVRIFIQIMCSIGIVLHKNSSKLPVNTKFYTGSTWFLAKIEVLDYILLYIENNPEYLDFWKNSLASDLMFFHTIIMASPYKDNIGEDVVYKKWGTTFKTRNHPITITKDDISDISCSKRYFARKFDYKVDAEVVDYYVKLIHSGENDE